MSSKNYKDYSVDDIMTFWSRERSIKDTAAHFGISHRIVEQMVARYSYRYERSFNFPQIMRAKRFGAVS